MTSSWQCIPSEAAQIPIASTHTLAAASTNIYWYFFLIAFMLLGTALIFGAIAQKLKQSPIIGYLLAGILLGPNTFAPWIFGDLLNFQNIVDALEDKQVLDFSELGVALLLFSIGLEFSLKKLRALGTMAAAGGSMQVFITILVVVPLAFVFMKLFKPNVPGASYFATAVAIGGIIALSSTACVLGLLKERGEMDANPSRNSLGILLLQDVAVVPLVIMVTMLTTGGGPAEVAKNIGWTLASATMLIIGFWVLFQYIIPHTLLRPGVSKNRELVVLLAITVAIGSSWIANHLGLSAALGAFIAGILLGESKFAVQIRADAGPLKILFMTLFFGAIGMLLDPVWIIEDYHWVMVILVLIAALIIKVGVIMIALKILKRSWREGLATGLILAQIGEFSFVLMTIAKGKVISNEMFNLLVTTTIISLMLTPFLIIIARKVQHQGKRSTPPQAKDPVPCDEKRAEAKDMLQLMDVSDESDKTAPPQKPLEAIIVGFGPAGQRIAEAMLEMHIKPHIIEMNPKTARAAQLYDLDVHIGNASQAEVLEHAHIDKADFIVITLPDSTACRLVIEQCRKIAPNAIVVARSRYHVFRWELEMAGAHLVVDEEEQVGLRIAHEIERMIREKKGEILDREIGSEMSSTAIKPVD